MSDLSQRIAKLSPEKLKLLAQQLSQKKVDAFSRPQITHQSRESNLFPLSFAQQRLWFLDQMQPGNIAYNIYLPMRLSGLLNVAALEQTFQEVVRRHAALRTTFSKKDGQPVQVIAPPITWALPKVNLQELPPDKREAEVLRLVNEEDEQPFDLAKGPLLRVTLLRLSETEHVLLFSMHHIISDGWSLGVFIREIEVLYEAFCNHKPSPLSELPIQYADYAVWEQQWFRGKVLETQLDYWRRQLGGKLPSPKLPTDRPRSVVQTFQAATYHFNLSLNLYQALQKLSQQTNVTLFMILLVVLATLLHRYTQQDDIFVGTNVSNRNQAETQGLIGFFVNILVLRTNLSGNPTFRELLSQVREMTLEAYDHQNLPFAKLVEELQSERHLSQTPMFELLFVMENASLIKSRQLSGLTMSSLQRKSSNAKFDLSLFITETEQGLKGNYWNYNADLFDATTIKRMSDHFEMLLSSIVVQPDTRINNLKLLTEAEKNKQIMAEVKQEENKFKKFKNFKPKVVKLPQGQLIKTEYLRFEETLPLVLKPDAKDLDVVDWAKSNREFLETQLLKHGAILLRDFNLHSVSAFENLAQAICPELFSDYGDLPREGISDKVYGSTPYPQDKAILFHNESSHLHRWPLKIWFFCMQNAKLGGETPIVDCRKVYQLLDPKLRERFDRKQLMYVRNYTEGLDVSWQDFFHTTDKVVVESYCRQAGIDFEWLLDNNLITRKVRPAISKHPKTGESVFFNQVQLHHVSCLDSAVRESLLSTFGEERLPRNVYYGDGSPIEESIMAEIEAVYQQTKVSFPWQQGDVLMLDNMLTAHGRSPYEGPRKIVVAMGEMICSEDI
ncbi:MAG: condensation domain-containing protein [Rhizonema sp. PD38]|nr:condensation domain-containing protein [Rhizonema sp. PD38]